MLLDLMIIGKFDIVGVATGKPKTNPPLVIHGDGMLADSVLLQFMKPVARWRLKIVHAGGQIDIFQPPKGPFPNSGREPFGLPRFVQDLRVPIRKGFNHCCSVICHVTDVNLKERSQSK